MPRKRSLSRVFGSIIGAFRLRKPDHAFPPNRPATATGNQAHSRVDADLPRRPTTQDIKHNSGKRREPAPNIVVPVIETVTKTVGTQGSRSILHPRWQKGVERVMENVGLRGNKSDTWDVGLRSVESLQTLPPRLPHAGTYEWIGKPNPEPPLRLWDSKESCTVQATKERLSQGYIAVSYTWGRWMIGERREDGTTWKLPIVSSFKLAELKAILKRAPHRYFWVDVLCINQSNPAEKAGDLQARDNFRPSNWGFRVPLERRIRWPAGKGPL